MPKDILQVGPLQRGRITAQPDVDTFDCSELTQWASGTPLEGGVRTGDWITDVTYESVELLGQSTVATETLTIAHEGFLFI